MKPAFQKQPGRAGLIGLATTRLLSAGPETCERIEAGVLAAIKKRDCTEARRLLRLRLKMRYGLTADKRATIDRVLKRIDEAEAQGLVPKP